MGDGCSKCDACIVHHQAICHGATPQALADLERLCHLRDVPRGQVIQGQGEDSEIVGNVISGVVRIVTSTSEGNQHIVGLLFPSDFFGRPFAETSRFSFEAATDVRLCCMPRKGFEGLLTRHPEIEHQLHVAKFDELDAMRDWAFIITGHTALQRVCTFLMMLGNRSRNQFHQEGSNSNHLRILVPISRRDMADFLGTTPETISRSIQFLSRRKVLRIVDAKQFELLEPETLASLAAETDSLCEFQ